LSPYSHYAQLAVVKLIAGSSTSVRHSPSCLAGDVPKPRPSLADLAVPSLRHRVLEPVRRRPFIPAHEQKNKVENDPEIFIF
jgi:hypothetical protein